MSSFEESLRETAKRRHRQFYGHPDQGEQRPDRTVRAPRNAFDGRMRDLEKSPYTDRTLKPNWRPLGQVLDEIMLDLPKPK